METSQKILRMAEGMGLIGERYSWYLGTKSTSASFDATCCSDMRVLLFNPVEVSKGLMSQNKSFYLLHKFKKTKLNIFLGQVLKDLSSNVNPSRPLRNY